MGTVVGSWRLRLIILLFIMITSIYSAYGLFGSVETLIPSANDSYFDADSGEIVYNSSDATDISTDFKDVVFGIGGFLTFADVDNEWARLLLITFVSIIWVTIGYIIFTFVKEFVPFV